MDIHTLFADAAWFRVVVVGVDILAVIAIVWLWNAVAAWWQAPFPHRSASAPARVRGTQTRLQRP